MLPFFVANLNHLRYQVGPPPGGRQNLSRPSLRHLSFSLRQLQALSLRESLVATFNRLGMELTRGKQTLSQISNRNKNAVSGNVATPERAKMRPVASPLATNHLPLLASHRLSNRHLRTIRNHCKSFNTKDVTFSNRPKSGPPLLPFPRALRRWPPPPEHARMSLRLLLPEVLQRYLSGLQGRACSPFHLAGTL